MMTEVCLDENVNAYNNVNEEVVLTRDSISDSRDNTSWASILTPGILCNRVLVWLVINGPRLRYTSSLLRIYTHEDDKRD